MYVLIFANGHRALYRGRRAGGCVLVKFQGEQYWWWMPEGFVKKAIRMPSEASAAV